MIVWLGDTLVATTILLAIVLLIRRPLARMFGARAAYALWLAPLVRMVLPPLPVSAPMPDVIFEMTNAAGAAIPTIAPQASSAPALILIWAAGCLTFLAWQIIVYRRFLSAALATARPLAVPGITDSAVLATAAVSGPCATGIFARRIFVPEHFERSFSLEEQELALEHEALHHSRRDLWASAAALLLLAIHWFNPLAHFAHRAFRRDLEAACDASVLEHRGPQVREAYARTILRCVGRPTPHPSCALTHIDELKGRLEMMKLDHGRARRLTGAGLAAVFSCGTLLLALPATAQDKPAEDRLQRIEIRKTIKDGKEVTESNVPAELRARMERCEGEKFEVDTVAPAADADGKKKRTRMLICSKPGATKAEAAAALEKVLGRIEGTDEMPAENKAQVVARLKARIAELKSGS